MKPIVLLAIVGIAAAALGMGSLSNTISLTVQDLGVGETTLDSPIDDAIINFGIEKIPANAQEDAYKNVIRYCVITNADDVDIPTGSKIFCKLTDINGNVAVEGSKVLGGPLNAGSSTKVFIDAAELQQAIVQNIHDVILVVQGPEQVNP